MALDVCNNRISGAVILMQINQSHLNESFELVADEDVDRNTAIRSLVLDKLRATRDLTPVSANNKDYIQKIQALWMPLGVEPR